MGHAGRAICLLGIMVIASVCRGELPPISVEELAKRMAKAGEAFYSLRSLQVEVNTRVTVPRSSSPAPGMATTPDVHFQHCVYRMRNGFKKEYMGVASAAPIPLGMPEKPAVPKDPSWVETYNGKVHMKYESKVLVITHRRQEKSLIKRTGLCHLFQKGEEQGHVADVTESPTWRVTFLPSEQYEGQECYVLYCEFQPKPGGPIYPTRRLRVCPELGYVVVHSQNLEPGGKVSSETFFHDFGECVPGVWLPGGYEAIAPDSINCSYSYTYSKVNEHIPLDQFTVHPPPGTTIRDRRFGKGWIPHWRDLLGYGLPIAVVAIAIQRYFRMSKPRSAKS